MEGFISLSVLRGRAAKAVKPQGGGKIRGLAPVPSVFGRPLLQKKYQGYSVRIDVPSPVVIRATLRVAIFSIEVPGAKNYVLEATAEGM